MAGVTPADEVLNVACGPGLVACEAAKVANHYTGIDLTPAMIDPASARQWSLGLSNLAWLVGDAQPLPFPDASFSGVIDLKLDGITRAAGNSYTGRRTARFVPGRVNRPHDLKGEALTPR